MTVLVEKLSSGWYEAEALLDRSGEERAQGNRFVTDDCR